MQKPVGYIALIHFQNIIELVKAAEYTSTKVGHMAQEVHEYLEWFHNHLFEKMVPTGSRLPPQCTIPSSICQDYDAWEFFNTHHSVMFIVKAWYTVWGRYLDDTLKPMSETKLDLDNPLATPQIYMPLSRARLGSEPFRLRDLRRLDDTVVESPHDWPVELQLHALSEAGMKAKQRVLSKSLHTSGECQD